VKITSKTALEEIGAIVCTALKEAGIEAFLSGGAVVSIYTENAYQSWDLDFISHGSFKKIEEVMKKLGFAREKGRHFVHPRSKFFVEFPGVATQIGDQPVIEFAERKSRGGILKLLRPTECVMDRLAAFYHWNDPQGLEQAVLVAQAHPVDLKAIERWSRREAMADKYREFLSELKSSRR
jgi:hypothetical protein